MVSKKENIKNKSEEEKKNTEILTNKENKFKKFFSELKALFLIILIIGGIIGIFFLIFKFVKPFEKQKDQKEETKVVESNDYKTFVYKPNEGRSLSVIQDKYVVEHDTENLYKIFDINGNIIFEGTEKYGDVMVGVDDELYLVYSNYNDDTELATMSLFKLVKKQLVEVLKVEEEGYMYIPLIQSNKNTTRIIGVIGEKNYFENDDYTTKSTLITLDNKKTEMTEFRFIGDTERLSIDNPVYTYSSDYVIIRDNNSDYKSGVYDIKNKKIIINTKYSRMYSTIAGDYIAYKEGKTGIIDLKSKKLVDFKYDNIYDAGNVYVTLKDDKMGILDKDFKEIIKPTFKYQELQNAGFANRPCCASINSFKVTKYNDKYVLTNNNDELLEDIDYKLHETYIIDSNGKYKTIKANEFGIEEELIYGYDKTLKKYVIYDSNFEEKYTIDLSQYDYENDPSIHLVNDNTIIVSLDTDLYFDFTTGVEMDAPKDGKFVDGKIEFKYTVNDKLVTIKVNGEEVATYTFNGKKMFNTLNNKMYYYASNDIYVMVKKSE